jgi:hypothetical protein
MRLLRFHDDVLTLTQFRSPNNPPPYAILSHTWGPEADEVTIQNVEDGSARDKHAYQKIRFCGEQAAHDHLEYFWIDTCCIDKSSTAELSEALNSMFRWYREATRCYVYLSDVHGPGNILQTFQTSRWFTRGWTLQELIAPSSVDFFTSNGYRLGDKQSLEPQIILVTSLPATALQGDALSRFSVKERLSWSNNRQTTREEDLAYSLQGIFGVFMPPLYGEGQDNAFRRLRREIEDKQKSAKSFAKHLTHLVKFGGTKSRCYGLAIGILLAVGIIFGVGAVAIIGMAVKRITSAGSANDSNLLVNSSLASVQWTDKTGYRHYFVFYQDPTNSLLCSIYDSQNTTWTTKNVSAALNVATEAPSYFIPGTSIAAVAYLNSTIDSFEMSVYALTQGNNIVELKTLDYGGDGIWQRTTLGTPFPLVTATQSRLAAHRPNCGVNCTAPVVIVYQNAAQSLCFSSNPDWMETVFEEQTLGNIYSPLTASGLSITSLAMNQNITDIGWRIYYARTGSILQEGGLSSDLHYRYIRK